MKILFTTESYYPIIDGGAIAQHRIVQELTKRGHEVNVIAPGFNYKNYEEEVNGSLVYRPRGIALPFYMNGKYHFCPFPFLYVKKIMNNFEPDIVNVNSPYPISMCALNIAKKTNIPVVGSIHILPENMLSPFTNLFFYKTLRKFTWGYLVYFYNITNWATIPTQTGAKMYKERGLKTCITAVSNGVDTTIFNPNREGSYLRDKLNIPDKKLVLYTGRINPEKNLEVLINAIPQVLKYVDAHFLLVGSGGNYKNEIMKLTEKLNVKSNTTFVDFLESEDYQNIYSIADVFVMPAEAELQSIVTMEAVASGLPVIVTDKGAVNCRGYIGVRRNITVGGTFERCLYRGVPFLW
jgi:glycosyltransferase involved in cell wall biosynthesis